MHARRLLQAKLESNPPADACEREADLMADHIIHGRPARPTHSTLGSIPIHFQPVTAQPGARASGAVHVPAGLGQPLELPLLQEMGERFGHDFSRVRVHSGAASEKLARDVNAQAYTAGHDIVFGAGRFAPGTLEGRRLIAHELTHVVQQSRAGELRGKNTNWGPSAFFPVQRKPLGPGLFPSGRTNYRFDTAQITVDDLSDPEITTRLHSMTRSELRAYRLRVLDPDVQEYIGRLLTPDPTAQLETHWTPLTKADLDQVAALNYWEQRTWKAFDLKGYPARMSNSAEERDAVYAILWQVFPNGEKTPPSSKLVTIPPNAQRNNALLYQFVVGPPAVAGGKPALEINFQRERAGSIADTALEPPKGYIAPQLSFDAEVNFPEGADAYFAKHREERRQIAYWVKQQSGGFEELVVTHGTPQGGNGPPQETMFLVSGNKAKNGEITQLEIELRPGGRPTEMTPTNDYRNRDYADLLLQEAQSKPHAKKGDTLGAVDVAGVPADEVLSVKYAIMRYFRDVETRNAEADVLVPIAGTNKEVYYTLRFRPDNEVDVERVGEKGSSPKLDPTRMDIARVRGYDANATDPAKLTAWLGKRYPGIHPAGVTVAELRASANQSMSADAGTAAWYEANYKLTVLSGAGTQTRLRNVHKLNPKQTPDADNQDYTPAELKLAELSLQTLTEKILSLLRYVRLGRKKTHREVDGTAGPYGGQAFWTGTSKTIVMYDSGMTDRASAFRGGAEGVNVPQAMLFTHEMGHIMEPMTGAKPAFDKFVKNAGIRPFTRYAESKPDSDFFTEAFAISQTDPEWLRRNHPATAQWFETFNRTGKAPK